MIHKFKFKDKPIVIDVNSGAVHMVNDIVYDMLDDYKEKSPEEIITRLKGQYELKQIKEALEEIAELEENEMLFSSDSYITKELLENKDPVVKALCLHIAHDCNMNCKYCFGEQGAFDGIRCLMSVETGKKAIDYLLNNSGERTNLEVDFFGGEPLMNFEVVKQLVDYGRAQEVKFGKNIRFTITTNGMLLDEEIGKYINETMDNVILSIDGRPQVNDKMRQTWNGKGTYDIISKKYLDFIKNRDGLYYVRGTFTKENLDFSNDVLHLLEHGFKNVSVEPVVVSDEYDFALKKEHLDRILKEYDVLADIYLDKRIKGEPFEFFHFNIDLEQGPCVIKRLAGCGAGTEYMAVSPEGDLYPCHQFVGNKEYLIGNLMDDTIVNKHYDLFNAAHVYSKETCQKCWAKFYCSGGCHSNALNMNGNIEKPYELGCEMEKKRVECAIGIKCIIAEMEEM